MSDWLLQPLYLNWWLLGLVLMMLEIVVPGTFMLWMGAAALGVGLLLIPFPGLPWQVQMLAFAALSLASILLWRRLFQGPSGSSDNPLLNRRGQQHVGRVLVLDAPIVNGEGRCRVGDSTWKVQGPDSPAGTRVRVTGVDGLSLWVEPESTDSPGRRP